MPWMESSKAVDEKEAPPTQDVPEKGDLDQFQKTNTRSTSKRNMTDSQGCETLDKKVL